MLRRILIAALALALAAPALAQARHGGAQWPDQRVPSAQLQAAGSGAMTIVGRMVVTGTIPVRGSVVVIDRAGDARVHLAGEPRDFRRGRLRVRRASGILFVRGSNVVVQILGVDLSFSVAGNGRALLLGDGAYQLNSGPEEGWSRAWIRVAPTPPEEEGEEEETGRCLGCSPSPVPAR